MSAFARKEINFVELESELQSAIDADARYWKENDAKFRAVNQKVQTYDEFRNIVKAAHLKPLEKKDHMNVSSKGCIWNILANKTNIERDNRFLNDSKDALVETPIWEFPASGIQFLHVWKRLNPRQHLNYLRFVINGPIDVISSVEIPAEVFQQIINALSSCTETEDARLVVDTLKSISESKRFTLMKDFLSQEDKSNCAQLIEKQIKSSRGISGEMLPLNQELHHLREKFCD